MQSQDYDNSEVEARWLREQRQIVQEYLDKEEVRLAKIEEKPVWFIAPHVALWKIESLKDSFWIISGDLPTDYFEASPTQSPREILADFGKRWKNMSEEMLNGNMPKDFHIGKSESQKELGALLKTRAQTLLDWSKDVEIWK